MAPVSHQETIVGHGSCTLLQEGCMHVSASLIPSRPDNLTISSFALWDNIIPSIILGFVAFWLCKRCTSGSFVFVYDESLCVRVREETRPRIREGSSGAGC